MFVRLFALLLLFFSAILPAEQRQSNEALFANITIATFYSLCVQPLDKLDTVRVQMDEKMPAIAPENALIYLREQKGRAWYIPYNPFTYAVLTISDDNRICSLRSYHGDPEMVQTLFEKMMQQPPKKEMKLEKMGPAQEHKDTGTLKLTVFTWENAKYRYAFWLHVFTNSKDPSLPRFFLVAETAPPITGE